MNRIAWPAALAVCALVSPALADTKAKEGAMPSAASADVPEIVARQWATEPVDVHNLQGNVVLLLFWQKPEGT